MARLNQPTGEQCFWCAGEKDTLLRKLLIEAAPILQNLKPAILVRISGCTCMDENRQDHLFCRHQHEIVRTLGLEHRILDQSETSVLVLFYARTLLMQTITAPESRALLGVLGYSYDQNLEGLLSMLEHRFQDYKKRFPHEVGLFLGYPFKDVIGFIRGQKPATIKHPTAWKVFDDPGPSLALMARIHAAREQFRKQLEHEPDVERFCLHFLQQRERAS